MSIKHLRNEWFTDVYYKLFHSLGYVLPKWARNKYFTLLKEIKALYRIPEHPEPSLRIDEIHYSTL